MAMRAGIAASSFVRQRTTCYWWSYVSSEERSQIAEVLDHGMRRVGMYRSSKLVLKSLPITKISIVLLYFQLWKSHIGECALVEWIRCSPVTGSICTFCIRVPRSRSEISTSSVNEVLLLRDCPICEIRRCVPASWYQNIAAASNNSGYT
ncbi:hypothetical protein T06_9315 [Trichinella sp. T6]|nr:hypothetical protein T06_14430 [Trichinella sp. T6]KRX76097.1 hypothetical protein T06_9315 [Trichinella sp. T6]